MKQILITMLSMFSLLLLSACTRHMSDEELAAALKPVKDRYAPDTRVAVFTIAPTWHGNLLVAKGEVDNPQARVDVLNALKNAVGGDVLDSVVVLPDSTLGEKRYGIITVSVANMRSKRGQAEELGSQLLMGMVVNLLKERGGWYYAQSHDHYLGWIEDGSLFVTDRAGVDQWISAQKSIVTDYFGIVRSEPNRKSQPVTDVVAGALLKRTGFKGSWLGVELPDGRSGYLESALTEDYNLWKRTRRLTPDNVEKTAKLFVGVPYLWGGTSPKGFDCSGYTKTVFRLNGLELNRDANQQATQGEDIQVGANFEGLKKGDLLFFGRKATSDRPERIWHVAIYLGHQEFIQCAGRVRVNSFDPASPAYDPERLRTFVRARRVIGPPMIPEIG